MGKQNLAVFACLLAVTAVTRAQDAWDALAEEHGLMGLSVVSRCGGDISTEAHVGWRDLERKLEINSETTFRVASISKAVVALVAARLEEDGLLSLDAPLAQHLDTPPVHPLHPEVPLTARHLLTHTSGLRDGSGYSDFLAATYNALPTPPPLGAVLEEGGAFFTADMWGTSAPGEWFQYANLNFGVLATVMEAATGMRFDELMAQWLFVPYGIDAGYRVHALEDIDDLAVLYRQQGGQWVPQVDQYNGTVPEDLDWSNYLPGVNAAGFSPQGGLRISIRDLTRLVQLWGSGEAADASGFPLSFLSEIGREAMVAPQWSHSSAGGGNGNNHYGLFNQWASGLHLAASGLGQDDVVPDAGISPFIGHPGEAYGLISDAYTTPNGQWGFALAINGKWDGYATGEESAFYAVEQDAFARLSADLEQCLTAAVPDAEGLSLSLLRPVRAGDTTLSLQLNGASARLAQGILHRADGKLVWTSGQQPLALAPSVDICVPPLSAGIHALSLVFGDGKTGRLAFVVGP